MDKDAKKECLKVILEQPEESYSDADRLIIKLLEQDIADGGTRFEQLYYASNSFYG